MPAAPDALSVVLRAVSFVLLLQAAGTVVFLGLFGRYLTGRSTLKATQHLGWRLGMVAVVFVTAQYLLEAGRMAGEMSGVVDPALQLMALRSPTGAAFALRVLGLVLIVVALRRAVSSAGGVGEGAGAPSLAIAGATLAIAAFAVMGHTTDTPHRAAAGALLITHLLVAAFWLGALWPLFMCTIREPRPVAARLIDGFSTVATWVVPGIALAGVGLAVLLVPGRAVFFQPYGRLLLAKVALFVLLMGMAAFNKWKYGPACASADPRAARAFRRTVALEYLAICAVLAVTAAMTTFYSPEAA